MKGKEETEINTTIHNIQFQLMLFGKAKAWFFLLAAFLTLTRLS